MQYKQFEIMQGTKYEDINGKVFAFYQDLITLIRPVRFYDLGCWQGGISAFMSDLGLPSVAIDIQPAPLLVGYNGVEFYQDNFLKSAKKYISMIVNEIGPVIVLCDGGGNLDAKLTQAHIYAPELRVGDVLLTHDFNNHDESGGTTPTKLYPLMESLGYSRLEMENYDPLLMMTSMHIRRRLN